MEKIFGTVTLVLAVSMVLFALPSQIKKQHYEKKAGLSWLMVLLAPSVFASRVCYGLAIKSWYILIPDALGVLFSIVLLVQKVKYQNGKEECGEPNT